MSYREWEAEEEERKKRKRQQDALDDVALPTDFFPTDTDPAPGNYHNDPAPDFSPSGGESGGGGADGGWSDSGGGDCGGGDGGGGGVD